MRTLHRLAVVPDIHMRHRLFDEAVRLHAEGFDVCLLGDYVDNGPQPNDPAFLREVFEFCRKASVTPLLGNHDLAYVYPDEASFRNNGYEPANATQVADVYAEYADLFSIAYRYDRYVCSHAGLSKALLHTMAVKYDRHGADAVVACLNDERPPETFYRSRFNGGNDPFDGPTWLRLPQYHGALTEEGITQVVGHSSQAVIRVRHNMLMIDVKRALVLEW